ncbi:hypothetical protein OIV83_003561 [Microbotryomycetes sp. JL201]|nr:hypothetical protein OIV83_003561 [Microbotryomycetes sp. JL201]
MHSAARPDTPRLSSTELLPPLSPAFERDLFRSTLGSSQRDEQASPMSRIAKSVRFYLPASPVLLSSPGLPAYESIEELVAQRSRALELQLYCWSFFSILLLSALFLPFDMFSSETAAVLHHLREHYGTAMNVSTYGALLATFRTGVARIAYGAAGDDESGAQDRFEGDLESKFLESCKLDEIGGYTDGDRVNALLDNIRDAAVQGLTLLSSAALLHLPVHALREYPLSASFAVWCASTALVGLLMWDAVRVATNSFSGDCDMPPEYECLNDDCMHKSDW